MVSNMFGLDAMAQGWYVGCALVGSIAGVSCAGVLSDWAGRRNTMVFSAVLFTTSAAGCAIAPSFDWLVIYRIIGGIGIGVVSIVSPLYISEISVPAYRGQGRQMERLFPRATRALPVPYHLRGDWQ